MLRAVPDDLAQRLISASQIHGDFVLSSGRRSNVYFDKFRFLTDPELLKDTAAAVAGLLPDGITLLAAPEGAATLLVAALSLEDRACRSPWSARSPRPTGRCRSSRSRAGGAEVALVEDVSSTGAQVLSAAKVLESAGCEVAIIVLAIDRRWRRAPARGGLLGEGARGDRSRQDLATAAP
jgi:orotate phosphoribosyltransferase